MKVKKIKTPRFDEFVAALRPDPMSIGDPQIVIQGFIGKSNEPKHIRLYFDEALNDFVDILEGDVQYFVPLSKEVSPSGGSKLWVKANALFIYGDPALKVRPKASFLQGDVMRAFEQQFDKPDFPQQVKYERRTHRATNPCNCPDKVYQQTDNKTCYKTCFTCQFTLCYLTCNFACKFPPFRPSYACEWERLFTPTPYRNVRAEAFDPNTATGFDRFNPYTTPNR